jgi:hypothetical protein
MQPGQQVPVAHVQKLELDSIFFMAEKDKTGLPDTVKYRPLLAKSLEGIPFKIDVDTILLSHGMVRYNEIAQKTNTEGHIFFSDIKGRITNIKNYNYTDADSIRARLTGKLMGQGDFTFNFRQSYIDSMQGFNLAFRMSRFHMPGLNTFLKPVVTVVIVRGVSDSTWMLVEGNDYVAFGMMDFRYNDLKLALRNKEGNKIFLSNFINGILNALVRNNSNDRRDVIYQERLRNKAIYGFWGKIAISGLLSNLGVKSEKKQRKKYKRIVQAKNLPDYSQDF